MNLICVDNDQEKINLLKQGTIPIYEPGLEVGRQEYEGGRLSFSTTSKRESNRAWSCSLQWAPFHEDGSADLQAAEEVAKEIGRSMNGYKVVVIKSQFCGNGPSTEEADPRPSDPTHPFDIVSNPEFQREGSAIEDFMRPDRVTIVLRVSRPSPS